jgi:SRSO17 transposase
MQFCDSYSQHFVRQGMNGTHHARCYLSGLMGTQRRKNIETIENDVAESDYQGMEQFISSSPWSHDALMDQLAAEVDSLIGDPADTGLIIDESSFLKKGKASVGVQRQWSGRAGKIENCQVAVFAALAKGEQMSLTDFRLFLPESWVEDSERCNRAKVPTEHRIYQAKWRQALEMVKSAKQRGMRFGWVGADSLYGGTAGFINGVEDLGEKFLADVNSTNKIWTLEPQLEESAPHQGKGRPRKHRKLAATNQSEYLTVEQLSSRRFEAEAREIVYRQGAKGDLKAKLWVAEVWTWEPEWASGPRKRQLVIRQDHDGGMKYSLTNLPSSLSWERYGYVQGQRFWVEHAFHEAKSQLGMAQYQVRVWRGWHHHMALVCLAMLFVLREKLRSSASVPLLSYRDLTELLDYYLPRRNYSEEEVMRQIQKRHRKRQQDLDRRQKSQI